MNAEPDVNGSARYAAIIVLANLMDSDGNLNEESRTRMDKAIEAYRGKVSNILVTCGWAYRKDTALSIADAMRAYALRSPDIRAADVLVEAESRDTVGDAVFTKRNLAVPRGWQDALVVTSQYHVERCKRVFSFVYGPRYRIGVLGAPSPDSPALRAAERHSLEVFESTFAGTQPGNDKMIMERLIERHPFYNGRIYPKLAV